MTLASRHRIIWFLFFSSFILNGLIFFFLIRRFDDLSALHPLSGVYQSWWLNISLSGGVTLTTSLIMQGLMSLATLTGALTAFLVFKRSSSQEIFYFQLFLLCLSLLSFRLVSYGAAWYRLPFSYTVIISRAVLFFRFSSLLFLLLSGLSVFDSRFQKSDPFFLAALLISLSLAATIPESNRFIQNTLTYLPVNEQSLFFLFMIIKIIIPVNFLWFFYHRKTWDYLLLTTAVILSIMAESLFYYMSVTGFIAGLLFLTIGTVLFSQRIYRLYLWR